MKAVKMIGAYLALLGVIVVVGGVWAAVSFVASHHPEQVSQLGNFVFGMVYFVIVLVGVVLILGVVWLVVVIKNHHEIISRDGVVLIRQRGGTLYHASAYQAAATVKLPARGKQPYSIEPVEEDEPKRIASPKLTIPNFVRYDDIRDNIPQGHALVGVSEHGLETKKKDVRAFIWIVGGSGVGKTNTVCIRIDDDYQAGHNFLGVDPHAFKDDSLTNALKPTPYASRFLLPIAQDISAINNVLQTFLDEFNRRKSGVIVPPYRPITLVVDEVGSMVLDVDKDNPLEVEVARKLKEIARICGQESRGFRMYGIYISQDAAGLSWLRKRALMVLGHQVLMMSERLLVCNQNRETANEMETWPIGRTVVYGIAFPEGQKVVQQPIFTPARIVEADRTYLPPMEDLRKKPSSNLSNGRYREEAQEVSGRSTEEQGTENELSTKKMLRDIGKRLRNGETRADILRSYDATKGRANQEIGAVIDMVVEEME